MLTGSSASKVDTVLAGPVGIRPSTPLGERDPGGKQIPHGFKSPIPPTDRGPSQRLVADSMLSRIHLSSAIDAETGNESRFHVWSGLPAMLQGEMQMRASTRRFWLREVSNSPDQMVILDPPNAHRCWRLKKQCQPSGSIRKRNNQNHETGTQIAKLEGRIEALTSTLESVVKATGVSVDLTPSLNTTSTDGSVNHSTSLFVDVDAVPTPLRDESTSASSHSNPIYLGGLSETFPPPLYEPTADEAEVYLDLFRNRMLPMFPFIHMSPDLKAVQLRQERPFLFRAIVAVATPSTQLKVARIEGLKYVLTKSAVLENQSNIDMLLSILTYIAWSTDPFLKRASNLSRMIMLAISLVYDLKIADPLSQEAHIIANMAPGLEETDRGATGSSALGFLEQQRAFLACFVLSSMYVLLFGSDQP